MGLNLKILRMSPTLFALGYLLKVLRTRLIISRILLFVKMLRTVMQLWHCDDVMTFKSLQRTLFCFENVLTLKAPIATKVVCFSHLLTCLRSLYGKQCGTRSVHAVGFYTEFVGNVRQLFAADHFSRGHFQIHFFLDALRVNSIFSASWVVIRWNMQE